ncbi:MAG: CapA family protein [Syntrophobacteraceae bacterium]|nr:CapA family protein [Desulfobacteraceae bacterium]
MPAGKSLLILPLAAALLCLAPLPASPGKPDGGAGGGQGGETKEIRLLFAGDILLSRGVEKRLERESESLVAALRPVFSQSDWAAGNLEGAVGSPSACTDAVVPPNPCFPVRGERAALLHRIGFRAIGMENNHSLDLGPAGRTATRGALVGAGLLPLTFEDSPQFFRFGEVTVGLVSFSTVSGGAARTGEADRTELRRKLRQARNLADYVFAYVHWGSEFLDWPDERQRQTARWLVKNGADILVGHHPHVVQKPEVLGGKPVFYSLGNLLFDQKYPATKEGMIADCRIANGSARCTALAVRTPASSIFPAVAKAEGEAERAAAGCALKARGPLSVNGIVLRPVDSGAAGGPPGLALEARKDGRFLWKTPRAKILSIEKMPVDGQSGKELLFTLERHYSSMDGEEGLRPCVYEARPDGLVSRWRGTSLAWPLRDAVYLAEDKILCALHRGDSFVSLRPESGDTRVAAYRWNGFGFSGVHDPDTVNRCRECFD